MELKDTVEGMVSADYKERFIAEYEQLKIRLGKLHAYNQKIQVYDDCFYAGETYKLDFDEPEHDCPASLLSEQETLMKKYLDVLERRALWERVTLPKD